MNVSEELLNPALQGLGEDDLSFSHFVIPFDEEEQRHEESSEIRNLRFCLNIRSTEEFKNSVFYNVETPDGLNWYCDQILNLIHSEGNDSLRNLIPEHVVDAVRKTWLHKYYKGEVVTPAPMRPRRVDDFSAWKRRGKKTPIQISSNTHFEHDRDVSRLRLNEAWVVPEVAVKANFVKKPTVSNYTTYAFKRWVHFTAQNLRLSITKKSQKVVGNAAAQFLYQQSNPEILHSSNLQRCLLDAKLYVYDFSAAGKKPAKPTNWKISDFLPKPKEEKRVLYYGNRVMTADNVLSFEPFFKRHKPRFVAVCKYLRGESSIIKAVLQQEVQVVVDDNKPKPLVRKGESYDKDKVMSLKGQIPMSLFKLCVRHFSGDKTVNYGALQAQFSKVTFTHHQMLKAGNPHDHPAFCPLTGLPASECHNCKYGFVGGLKEDVFDPTTGQRTAFGERVLRGEAEPQPVFTLAESLARKDQADKLYQRFIKDVDRPIPRPLTASLAIPSLGDVKAFTTSKVAVVSEVLDTLLTIKDYLTESGWLEPLKLITMLLALHQQTTWKGCLSVISMYAVSVNTESWRKAFDKLKSFTPPTFRLQNGEECAGEVPKGVSFWESLSSLSEWGKEIWSCLTELIWTTILPCFMPEKVWEGFSNCSSLTSEFVNKVRTEVLKTAAKSVAETVIQTLLHVFSLIKTCIRMKSFKPLLADVFDPIKWREEVIAVSTYYAEIQVSSDQPVNVKRWTELKSGGHIPSYWFEPFTPHELHLYVDKLVKDGDDYLLTFRSDPVLGNDMRKLLAGIRALQEANSIGYGVMAKRVQPYGIYLAGIAGCGKTNLAEAIFKTVGRANGYSTEPTMKYAWQKGVNFQDSLGFSQWCITLDDIDTSVAQPQAGFETHVESVIRIINNDPLVVEQSRVEAKGKVASKPLLVIMTSNFDNGRLKNFALEPTRLAFYRRFPLWVKMKANDKCGSKGVLTPDGIAQSIDGEMWDFEIYKFDPNKQDQEFPYSLTDIKTKSALLRFIVEDYRTHMNRQLNHLKTSVDSSFCPLCYADWKDGKTCSCKQQEQMRWEYIVFPTVAAMLYRWLPPIINTEREFIRNTARLLNETLSNANDVTLTLKQAITTMTLTQQQFSERVERFWSHDFKYVLGAGVVIAIMSVTWKLYQDYEQNNPAQHFQLLERNAVAGSVPSAWVRAPQEFRVGMPVEFSTFTKDDAIKHIRDSYVRIVTKRGSGNGLVVSNNGVICPLHYFRALDEFDKIPESTEETFEIHQSGIVHKLLFNMFNVTQLYADSVFIKVPGLTGYTGLGKKFWIEIDTSVSQFDELILVKKEDLIHCNGSCSSFNTNRIIKSNAETSDGDCGYVYLARMNKHWKIVGMHTALHDSTSLGTYAVGMVVTQTNMMAAASRLSLKFQMCSIPLKQTGINYNMQSFSYYPPKSEVWSAVSHHGVQIAPIGKANLQIHGSTMKTEIKPTIYASEFEDLETEWCGRADYWQVPNFKGEMRGPVWVSPFTNSLIPLKRVTQKTDFLYLCLMQYLMGVEDLQTTGYSEISLEEAIVGIPGSVIQAVDLKTSVGMPYNQPKVTKIAVRDSQAFVDPGLLEVLDEFKQGLDNDIVVCPIVLCQLKDEAISHKKNEAKRARVFNVLPFAFNWLMKAKTAGIEAFMRANKGFFGSMVGINMTSLEINEVVRILARTDPELERIIALDIESLDKAEDGTLIDLVALVFYSLGAILGTDADAIYSLVQGLKSGVYVIKNDLFQIGGVNPSGQDKTVTFNCIITSLSLIYFYMRMKFREGLPSDLLYLIKDYQVNFFKIKGIVPHAARQYLTYREHCSKATYGDDSLQSIAKHCDFYDVNAIPSLGLELGLVFTDEAKTQNITFKKITECSFLKRTFVYREDLQSYVGQLAKKTLVKMLRLRKKSSLTERDHAAEQLTNVLRELAYYDREVYDLFKERFHSVAVKYQLTENAYYRSPSYDEYYSQMKDGSFSTWSPIVLSKEQDKNSKQ